MVGYRGEVQYVSVGNGETGCAPVVLGVLDIEELIEIRSLLGVRNRLPGKDIFGLEEGILGLREGILGLMEGILGLMEGIFGLGEGTLVEEIGYGILENSIVEVEEIEYGIQETVIVEVKEK